MRGMGAVEAEGDEGGSGEDEGSGAEREVFRDELREDIEALREPFTLAFKLPTLVLRLFSILILELRFGGVLLPSS